MTINSELFYCKSATRYDIHCANATIAQYLFGKFEFFNRALLGTSFPRDISVCGKVFSFTLDQQSEALHNYQCEQCYNEALKELAELFRIEMLPEDYPMRSVRVHIRYFFTGMAVSVYNEFMVSGKRSQSVCYDNISEISLESDHVIAFTCSTWEAVNCQSRVFREQEKTFVDRVDPFRTRQYARSEKRALALVNLTVALIIFLSLLSLCV